MKPAKQYLTAETMELALELSSQPRLFSDKGVPEPSLLKVLNGSRLERDEQRCLAACALRMLHRSDREIAATLHCDVRSIPLLLAAAEKSGRIPALKERLTLLAGANAETANIALGAFLDAATTGKGDLEDAAMIKSLATAAGISTEKYLLLTGSATEIVEHRIGAGREEMEAWARQNAIPIEPIDSGSNQNEPKALQSVAGTLDGHVADTSARDLAAAGPSVRTAQTGGGGASPRVAAPE